jgi:murein DD-endopeptidase MepM/ murein hydrolase activator NlpD
MQSTPFPQNQSAKSDRRLSQGSAVRFVAVSVCIALLNVIAMSVSVAATASSSTNSLPRESRVPGGVAIMKIAAANTPQPTVTSNGAPVWVTRHNAVWHAVIGIPLSTAVGTQQIVITQAGQITEQSFAVKSKRYPVQKLKLDRAMVDPPREVTARIERESAHLKMVRSNWRASDATNARFVLPASGRLSSRFGVARVLNGKPRSPHAGLDVAVGVGTPIHAAADGVILDAGDYYYCGKTVFVDHGNGLITMHCHLSEFIAKIGDTVKQGERIAVSGGTGRATGPHLHWSVYLNGVSVEPELFLPPAK